MSRVYKILAFFLLAFLSNSVSAQSFQLKGIVYSKSKETPLAGASIQIKGTNQTTLTNDEGKFSLEVPEKGILVVSYTSFENIEVPVTSEQGFITIKLKSNDQLLEEVVVTALGISKEKKSLGYAVQELKAKDISTSNEPNLVNALSGKVAGVRITNSQGDMGSARIIIRGETSISGNNQPLFVVNGIPVDNSQLGAGGSRDFANAISDINANDIESISVLKGPNAAALYGSRAAAGVILIKTKSGKAKKGLGISVNSEVTFQDLLILPSYQNKFGQGSDGKFSYVDGKGGGINDGTDESWGPRLDGRLIPQFNSKGEPVPFIAHPNNVRDFFRTGYVLNNGISIADATDKIDYRFSYNNFAQAGVIPNSSQGKNAFALNTTLRLTPKISFTADANYNQNVADNIPGSGGKRSTSTMLQFTWFGRQVDISQLKNYLDEDGNQVNWNNSYYSNPYFVAYQNTVQQQRNRLIGKVGFNYKISNELNLNFSSGTDYYNDRRKLKVAYGTNGTPFGSYEEDAFSVNENNTEAIFHYDKKTQSYFSWSAFAGGNIRSKYFEENDQLAPKLAVAGLYSLNNSRDPLQSSNYFSRLKTYSAFASGQVGFRNYAYINVTGRNDWSSTLPAKNRSFFYPSINGSLILSEALDIKSEFLNYAKLRGGVSRVGKEADPYQLINTYLFSAPFGSSPQLSPANIDLNKELKPETTTSSEVGLEMELLKRRLRIDVSAYNSNSYDQILGVDVSPTTGFKSKLLNAGKINNKGFEIQLGIKPVQKGFTWDVNVNFAMNRSKVIELDKAGLLESYIIGSSSAQVIASVGKPYGTLFGTAFLRDSSGQVIVNASGIPQKDPTRKVLGKYPADWVGGITNSFSYKNIRLSVLVDASVGGSVYNGTYATGTYTGVLSTTLPGRGEELGGLAYYYPGDTRSKGTVALGKDQSVPNGETIYHDGIIYKGVTADGKTNTTILPAQSYYKSFNTIDEANIFDASYAKLREITLGYQLPKSWIKKLRLEDASVSLIGRNLLFIFKNVPHIDPETAFNTGNAQGLESLSLPTTRSYGVNINLKF